MKSDEVRASMESASSMPMDMPHEAFSEFVAREATKWAEVIRKAGVTLE